MSDFRVVLRSSAPICDTEHELDWDKDEKKWFLSEKDVGIGQSWWQNLNPSHDDLKELLDFFRINPKEVRAELIARMSPGELTLFHRNTNNVISIYGILCDKCNEHWYIFRWEKDKQRWVIYGRNCDFSWRRGANLSKKEIKMLGLLRHMSDNPVCPASN